MSYIVYMIARAGQTADFFFRKLIVNKVTSDKYKVLMQVISEVYAFLYCSVLSLGGKVNTRRMSKPQMESIFKK